MNTVRLSRAEFDALVAEAAQGIIAAAPSARNAVGIRLRKEAGEDAALLEATAREFADQVDRLRPELDYADAVLIEGTAGPVVVSAVEWRDTPAAWETSAAGALGRIDRRVRGDWLLEEMRGSR